MVSPAPALWAAPDKSDAQPPPHAGAGLLSKELTADKLATLLLELRLWKPYPTAAERSSWEALPAEVRATAIAEGEAARQALWPTLPATAFLLYRREGNRTVVDNAQARRRELLRQLVIAECCEGKGRFLDPIANGIWATCEETWWGSPAHLWMQKDRSGLPDAAEPVVDLFAAETAALLAWTHYLLGRELETTYPLVPARIRREVAHRVILPCRRRNDFWWMGFEAGDTARPVNNWNPWINSNWLTALLLLEEDKAHRAADTAKIARSLDCFLAAYGDDGGCDEGPVYWNRAGASLFECLELLRSASGGRIDFFGVEKIREIGCYIYRAHIAGNYYLNFADASAQMTVSAPVAYRYGQRIQDEKLRQFGAWASRQEWRQGHLNSIGRQLPALFDWVEVRGGRAEAPYEQDVWLPSIQVMAARERGGSVEGLYLGAQGGHNAESHNHNDIGNFLIYMDGKPAIIDVGVETYTSRTFSSRRYEIWTMQSAYHNCPTVNGLMQGAGRRFEAREVSHRAGGEETVFALELSAAYPEQAGVESWRRTLRLSRRRGEIELMDVFRLSRREGETFLTLMAAGEVRPAQDGALVVSGGKAGTPPLTISFDAGVLQAVVEPIAISDAKLQGVWGERIHRIRLVDRTAQTVGSWKVLFQRT